MVASLVGGVNVYLGVGFIRAMGYAIGVEILGIGTGHVTCGNCWSAQCGQVGAF
ncbi:MAG: hypothetical protein S4CHLAM102_12530 [Chlamydiia bacterium]|nr:hypothetical protein [Chlamydiia bacterium]